MYLNSHTYYSLRYGVFDARTLVELAQENRIESLALTDINSTSACMNFIREARKCGVKPVVGVDIRNGVQQRFILIAKNNDGFQRINQYLTTILLKEETALHTAPELEDVWVIYPFVKGETRTLRDNEFIGVRPENIPSVRLQKCATDKMVILQPASFRNKKDFNTHRLLRAIDLNTLLSKLPTSEQALSSDQMLPLERLLQLFEGYPEIIRNTQQILEESNIDFDLSDDKEPQNQKTYTDSEKEDMELLLKLCKQGIKYRYPVTSEVIFERISRELDTIQKMGFVSYFLMNWDIVSYARSKGYFYVGRGSGANSVVASLLRITDVDPIELDLYFERFVNLYRKNPPDFDIDFSWRDRDDITHYIFTRFKHVALVATYNTFQRKAVLRELGKVFGLPKEEIDVLTKELPGRNTRENEFSRRNTVPIQQGQIHHSQRNHLTDLVIKYAQYIHGFPSHLSVHPSGIVVAEKPIHYFSPTFLPPKGYPTLQFDMHVAEDVGLYKFDILSQRGLGKIKDTLEIIRYNRPDQGEIDIHNMRQFKSDERIKQMLREAKAIGCFYVESPAMRMLLRKLQVDDYLGLVAASSVIRPGVSKSGMMSEYIKRFRHPEHRKDANPVLLELMPETFGVMVYQEDVIKVAYHFAGLTLGEADKMRRGMSGKFRSREEFQAVKEKFFRNCLEMKGHTLELTAEVWRQTESFAGYAFAKGHSASYAVESYQCLFLKAYFPLEFMVATINNYGGFYSTELYIQEARKFGGIILSPCVNNSQWATVISGNKIYLGFHLIKSFDSRMGKKITKERIQNGPFSDLNEFLERISIGIEQLILLMRMDAFRFTGKDKRTLLWEAHLKVNKSAKPISSQDLFRISPKEYQIPALSHSEEEGIFDQMELLEFPLSSPFTIVRPDPTPFILAKDLHRFENQNVWIKGYLIHAKRTSTSKGDRMFFGTFLDEEGEWLDTVHFPQIAAQFPFRGKGVYKVYGTVLMEYDCTNVQVISMEKMSIIEDPRYSDVEEEKPGDIVTVNRRTHAWSRSNIAQAEVKARNEAQTLTS